MELPIIKKIKREHVLARKTQDKLRAVILGTLLAEIRKVGKDDGNRQTTDQESELVISKFLKNLNETFKLLTGVEMLSFNRSNDDLIIDQKIIDMLEEADIYMSYLPEPLTEKKQDDIINELINSGIISIGQIMGKFSKDYRGLYDGKILSTKIKIALGQIKTKDNNEES